MCCFWRASDRLPKEVADLPLKANATLGPRLLGGLSSQRGVNVQEDSTRLALPLDLESQPQAQHGDTVGQTLLEEDSSRCRPVLPSLAEQRVLGREASQSADLSAAAAHRRAVELLWNFDLDSAMVLLDARRMSSLCDAAAYAELHTLRAVITCEIADAAIALKHVRHAEALRDGRTGAEGPLSELAREVIQAELLLCCSILQVILGARLRAIYNLRLCWQAFHRLEQKLPLEKTSLAEEEGRSSAADLRGRILFGLGLFYLVTSLAPSRLVPFMRLAGFAMNGPRGKAFLTECVVKNLGHRSCLAAIILAMYHLDMEPDISQAGSLVVASLGSRPENALLHWAGSILAWRSSCLPEAVEMSRKALWCCGDELGKKAIFLRYELGMLEFICMRWESSYEYFKAVQEAVKAETVFFPYKALVTAQLAATCFSLGRVEEGERLCLECQSLLDWGSGFLPLESCFAKVLQVFHKHRFRGRMLLAFEAIYLLRQLSKVPADQLQLLKDAVQLLSRPFLEEWTQSQECEVETLVELASALLVQTVILFYLGSIWTAVDYAEGLVELCPRLPAWATYISAHGLYWAGRIQALAGQPSSAVATLKMAKAYSKYPFMIQGKISKVLAQLERAL